jgi:TolA-binding protein
MHALVAGVVLVFLSSLCPRIEAEEAGAFDAAAEEFKAGFWKSAEADFSDFARKYPESTNLPYAFLCQAVARFHQTNYAGTIELLSGHQAQAGKLADDYLFWQAKALQAKGDSAGAAGSFRKLIQQFPASRLCLEAGVEEAQAEARLGDWPRVIELLRTPDGIFQKAVVTNASSEAIVSGWLLLGEAQLARRDYVGVEESVKPLEKLHPNPVAAWQWHYLVSRLRVAQGRPTEALAASSNLLAEAAGTGDPGKVAESHAFVAGLFERLGRTEEAINVFTNNLAGGIPVERQTQALTNLTRLLISAGRLPDAVARLEEFVARVPDAPSDLALLLLGELRLKQQALEVATNRLTAEGTNAPPGTTPSIRPSWLWLT